MNAATDPTDRSMWPATMTSTMPIASTRMYPFCTIRFEMFCGRSRMPLVVIVKNSTTAIRAMKMPFLPRSLTTCGQSEREPVRGRADLLGEFGLGARGVGHQRCFSMVMSLMRASWVAFFDGELPGDAAFGQGVDAIADAQQLDELGRDDDDRLPLGRQAMDDRVDLVLGADVDAAGRLVEDEHVRSGVDPLREDHLLLVAAGQLAGRHHHIRGLDVQVLAEPVRDLELLAVVHQAEPWRPSEGMRRRCCA